MDLRQLETFVAVAEEGGFTRAADRLFVVQSAVSASVRALERELGEPLFARTTRRVELTDAGRALLPEARRVLQAVDGARDAVAQVRGGLRGRVVLGTMQAQGMRVFSVPALLAAFAAEHPAVEVVVRHGGGSLAMAGMLADGTLDLAFLALTPPLPDGVELTLLAREPMVVACPADHPLLASGAPVPLAEVAREPGVDLPAGWGTRAAADRAFDAAGLRRTVRYEINDTASVVEFVRAGLAVALMPRLMAAGVDGIGFAALADAEPTFDTYLALPAARRRSAATEALAGAATALAGGAAMSRARPGGQGS